MNISYDEVKKDVVERDEADSNREHAPLAVQNDAFVVDTTTDTIEDTVRKVKEELVRRKLI